MSIYKSIERDISKAVQKSMNNHLIASLGPALTERFQLDEQEVNDYLTSFFQTHTKNRAKRSTAYSEFQKDKRKKYLEELHQKGILTDSMTPKERMKVASNFVAERWKSMKAPHHAQDLEYYKKLAQQNKANRPDSPPKEKAVPSSKPIKKESNKYKDKIKDYIKQHYIETGYLNDIEGDPNDIIHIFIEKYDQVLKNNPKTTWKNFKHEIIDKKMASILAFSDQEEDSDSQ